jgi:tetratricopeptide (TPR) repeat protein
MNGSRAGWAQSLVALVGILGLGSPALAGSSAPSVTSEPMAPSPTAAVAATNDQGFATLEAVGGQVMVIRLGQSQEPSSSMALQLNDVVVTKRGRATVRFQSDGTVLRVGPDTRVQIGESAKERDIQVFFGRMWAHVVRWKERPTRFLSGGTIAAMRGTELGLSVEGDETQLSVLEGRVLAENDSGSLMIAGGQVAVARKGSAPVLRAQVRPRDAVVWALYYLPVIYPKAGELGEGQGWQGKARESTEAYLKGDLKRAIDSLEGVPVQDVREPRFFTYRASLLLAAGSVEEAGKDLERALQLASGDAQALALQAVIAIVNNENDKALDAAQRAVAADPQSATAQIALSYARQARFDLEGARGSLDTAVRLKPDDALAWARLAEIRSSFGELDGALAAARKAIELEPNLARTQTVLGYAYLTQVNTRQAREAFQKAVELDQADPLPRLGLGLTRIRDGELQEGSKEIEVAVSLDPGQSLLRSYLGKAYFEAKRTPLVEREYDLAKESDPKDPTPWLYDAIAKQTSNRPVEALSSFQEAIELNDNRAVYRSRLLLDSDLAARSASLGRIYTDLGFQDLGLVEGWNSVNTDPSNYSSHRLLADSYAALPRHEIARVSELFQSQMLQPLNTTPIQPSLGESNLFLISSQGPGAVGFNEFNPLFNRNQVNAQGSFLFAGGSCGLDKTLVLCPASLGDTLAGEGIVSGIYDKASFSAGYSGFKTDGFRQNSTQDDKIANAFAQVEVSPSTSLQAEVRHRKLSHGDLALNFLADDFSESKAETIDGTNERIGLRHDFGPGVTFLASYMHSTKDIGDSDEVPDFLNFGLDRNEKANSLEGQFLFRSPSFKVVGGAGYFDIGAAEKLTAEIFLPDFTITNIETSDTTVKHTNMYAYSYVPLPSNLTLTLGVSGDLFDETGTATSNTLIAGFPPGEPAPTPAAVLGKKNKANPKAGITWTSKSGTTLRAAWFETLKRTLVTDQTLEPTQVAGFNQFFDDLSATRSRVYGAAIDQKFGRKAFGGGEYSERVLTIPQTLIDINPDTGEIISVSVKERDGHEHLARAYLFAAPHPWLTFGAEYQYENLRRAPELSLSFQRVETHRVPLSARFFHPSGLSAFVGVTYLKQKGEFKTVNEAGQDEYIPRDKNFWVVDAGLRYRLPKRYGFLVAGVNNLTDERSTYQATDPRNLAIRPGRVIYGRVVVAFP